MAYEVVLLKFTGQENYCNRTNVSNRKYIEVMNLDLVWVFYRGETEVGRTKTEGGKTEDCGTVLPDKIMAF